MSGRFRSCGRGSILPRPPRVRDAVDLKVLHQQTRVSLRGPLCDRGAGRNSSFASRIRVRSPIWHHRAQSWQHNDEWEAIMLTKTELLLAALLLAARCPPPWRRVLVRMRPIWRPVTTPARPYRRHSSLHRSGALGICASERDALRTDGSPPGAPGLSPGNRDLWLCGYDVQGRAPACCL